MTLVGSRVEWVLALLACWRMGAVALPCNPQLRRKDLELRVARRQPEALRRRGALPRRAARRRPRHGHGGPRARSSTRTCRRRRRPRSSRSAPRTRRLIVFTSGTTGEPRGVVYPQRYLLGQELQAEHWFGAREGELAWCTAAPGWSKSTRNVFVAPWLSGAAAVLHDGRFDPAERLDIARGARRQRALPGADRVPDAGQAHRAAPGPRAAPPGLGRRAARARGDRRLPRAPRARSSRRLRPDRDRATSPACARTSEPARDGSMGRPLPGIETRIVDGELQLRAASSPTFFCRYLDGERFEGEWWPTGDQVREDEDGYLCFEGRDDDMILSSGYRIGPFEVESALVSHPAVAEAAAVAAPDPERGSVVRAIVVLREPRALRRARPRAAGARQGADRPLQVPPHRRVRRRAAEDDQRQDQAGRAARSS